MSTNLFADVRRFALYARSHHFSLQPKETLNLCYKLVHEEVVVEFLPDLLKYMENPSLENLAKAADGAIDGIYVLVFFLNQMGLPGQKLWDIVQAANLAKFPNGEVYKNEFGKVTKPPGWVPPDEAIMAELIEWNTYQRGEKYEGGLIKHLTKEEKEKEE